MTLLYSAVIILLWPLVILAFVWRYGLRRTLRGLPERFGVHLAAAPVTKRRIWVHAASVGEVRAVEPLLRELRRRLPQVTVGLTTTSIAGKELADGAGIAAEVRLAPLDLTFCADRLLRRWRPEALVLVETELWPNWMRAAARRNVPLVLVNGRISDRTFRSYHLLKFFWKPLMAGFTVVGAQSPRHAERFAGIGTPASRLRITGNLKYDVPLPDLARRGEVLRKYGFAENDFVVVAGSLHPGEEDAVTAAFAEMSQARTGAKLLLAPRQIDRAADFVRAAERRGLRAARRSERPSPGFEVLVLDTLGELAEAYGAASIAFVGGSFARRGGQNPLEPARWGAPVLFGPHMENFQEIRDAFVAGGGAREVAPGRLAAALSELAREESRRRSLGEAARRLADSQRGAVNRTVDTLAEVLSAR